MRRKRRHQRDTTSMVENDCMITLDDTLNVYSVNIAAAGFNLGVQSKEAYIQELINELSPDVLFLLETDTLNFKAHETLKTRGYKQFSSEPVEMGAKGHKKTRVIALVKFGVVKCSDQIKHGVGHRAEIWLEVTLKNNSKIYLAGIYREWVGGRAGRDDEGFRLMLRRYASKRVIAMGDYNECIVKAKGKPESKQGEFLDSVQQLGYRAEDAGYTYHKSRNGGLFRSGLDWALTNIDGCELEQEEVPFSDHSIIKTKVEGKLLMRRRKRKSRNKNKTA